MNYKNITIRIENVSDSQKSDLQLAEKLLGLMNSVINMSPETSLTYKGQNFIAIGYDSIWVTNHISNIIKLSPKNYKEFALEELEVENLNSDRIAFQIYVDRNIYFHTKHLESIPDSGGTLSETLRSLIQSLNSFSSDSSIL
jgi:hypothetical protein